MKKLLMFLCFILLPTTFSFIEEKSSIDYNDHTTFQFVEDFSVNETFVVDNTYYSLSKPDGNLENYLTNEYTSIKEGNSVCFNCIYRDHYWVNDLDINHSCISKVRNTFNYNLAIKMNSANRRPNMVVAYFTTFEYNYSTILFNNNWLTKSNSEYYFNYTSGFV